jgi:hypothetical protein
VVAADDKVRGTKVFADDGVPDGFARAAHAHGEGQKGKLGHAVGVGLDDGLVDANAGEGVDVAGLGEADDGVDEDVGLVKAGGPDGELAVGAVHGVAGLEGDDLAPGELLEQRARLTRLVCATGSADRDASLRWHTRTSQSDIVVVHRGLDRLDGAADVEVLGRIVQVGDGGMRRVVGAEDELGFAVLVRLIHITHCASISTQLPQMAYTHRSGWRERSGRGSRGGRCERRP